MQRGVLGKPAYGVLLILALLAVTLAQPGLVAQEKGIAGVSPETMRRERPRRWAVIVGINDYEEQEGIGNLKYAVDDAEAMRDLLVGVYGFRPDKVALLTDKTKPRATKKAIMSGLLALSKIERENSRVLFYFSGHGQTADAWGGKAGYLVPCDAGLSRRQAVRLGALEEKCVPMSEVRRRLGICGAYANPIYFRK